MASLHWRRKDIADAILGILSRGRNSAKSNHQADRPKGFPERNDNGGVCNGKATDFMFSVITDPPHFAR